MRKTCCVNCATERVRGPLVGVLIAGALTATAACAPRSTPEPGPQAIPRARVEFFNDGKLLLLGVDVRAARINGPSEFLPLQVLLENRGKQTLRVERESFVLERPDGMLLPICSIQEFRRDYQRSLADTHLGAPFLDTIAGRFPEPPFHWQPMDFFPLRTEATAPRNAIDVRFGDVVHGYIYFRQPNLDPRGLRGVYKLLMKPGGAETTFVVDLMPYDLR
jgi:hypothetical protein